MYPQYKKDWFLRVNFSHFFSISETSKIGKKNENLINPCTEQWIINPLTPRRDEHATSPKNIYT